ncbi:amidase family protein [Corynebacterium sp. NPDC060344]|uniref:amidase family protein n=1 Tax=Corynebacterium sp. NPDC060344 TaxID=3347101 RepID=UPI003648C566
MGLSLIWDAYGASFASTAIVVTVIAAAVLMGLYALTRIRGDRPWGKVIPTLLIVVALVAGVIGGAVRVLQQAGGLQRQEGEVLTLDDDTNSFPRQTDIDMAAFDRLIDRVGGDRLSEMKERFAGADMTDRHRMRVEHGYTATDMLAYYVWRMKGQGGADGPIGADYAKGNSYFRAVMDLDPRAIEAADMAGAADPNNPMHGAIVLVKGNIAVEGLVNDSGSWALADATAGSDADAVQHLRDGGAIIAGRTNLSEFANFLTSGGPNGFSGRGGQVLSPQGPLTVDPLGSSTGSATAIALDYADVTVGTETSGSVLAPAGAAGVVGLKAPHDGCSISGIVPIDDRVDSVGFLGRSIRDVQLAHDATCWQAHATGAEHAPEQNTPKKIMVLGEIPESLKDRAKKANIDIVEAPEKIADLNAELDGANSEQILLGGFGPSLEAHLRGSVGMAKTVGDVAKYYADHPDTAPYGDGTLRRAVGIDDAGRKEGERELERVKKIVADIDAELRAAGVDALVTSTTDLASFSLAGVPRISVPLETKKADDVTGKESPEVAFQVTAARSDALPQVLAIAAALGTPL